MEAEARYTLVGAGVLALLVALLLSLLWLRNTGGKNSFNHYAIHFEQQALDGLEVGADVTLLGIKVGRVEDYALAGARLDRVRVEVRIDPRAPVRTSTVAVVTRNFVTGIAAITLINGEPLGPALVEVPSGEVYPVIAEGRSDLDQIAGRVNKVGEMASTALGNLNQLLDAGNRRTVSATLRSLRDLSAGLNERLGALDTTLQQVSTAATEVGRAATSLSGAGERIASAAGQGADRLGQTLTDTEQTLAEARRALQQVQQAGVQVQQQAAATAQRLERSAVNVDDQLGAALAELRLSTETATRLLDSLRDPRATLLGPDKAQLGPGERLP